MKIQLIKPYLSFKAGEVITETPERVNYLLRVGVAIEPKEEKAPKATKELKSKRQTK